MVTLGDVKNLPVALTVAEAAKLLKVGNLTVYNMIHEDEIPYVKYRSVYRIPTAELLKQLGIDEEAL